MLLSTDNRNNRYCNRLLQREDHNKFDEASINDSFSDNNLMDNLSNSAIKSKIATGELKIVKRTGKSKVWQIFGTIANGNGEDMKNIVACKKCGNIYKYNKNTTSNLVKHKCYIVHILTNRGSTRKKDVTAEIEKEGDKLATKWAIKNCRSIKFKIATGELKIVEKTGKSKVWQIFGTIVNSKGEVMKNIVACKKCGNIYKYKQQSTSNLLKHKCYIVHISTNRGSTPKKDVTAETKKEGVKLATEWAIKNCRPYKIVADSGLQKFAEYFISIGAMYGKNVDVSSVLPNPTTISRNIESLYETYFEKVKTEIDFVKRIGFGLTTDIWVDNYLRKHYLAVTLHYTKNGSLITTLLGLQSMKEERCTSQNIRSKICNVLNEFGLDLNSKAIIVTDRESNMIAAFRSDCNLFCINHLLHNVLQKAFEDCDDVREICQLCTQLVRYFKKAGLNSALSSTLKSFSPTRWNTVYYLLVSVVENWADVYQILQERNELQKISNIHLHQLKQIIKILEVFEKASKKLEGENYATIHLTYIYIQRIKKACVLDVSDTSAIKIFKEKLAYHIESTVVKNLSITHKIALFLFPPANKLLLFSEDEKNETKTECKRLIESCIEDSLDFKVATVSTFSPEDNELYSEFFQKLETPKLIDQIEREIQLYENTNVVFHADFEILQWWEVHKNEFPNLYKVSCKILAVPSSSAASERVFSTARNIITEKRCSISCNDSNINKIMFLHFNIKEF